MKKAPNKATLKNWIAKRLSKELKDGYVVNIGMGIPSLALHYLPDDVNVVVHMECGIVGAGNIPEPECADPFHMIDPSGLNASINVGGAIVDSATSHGLIRGGHIDVTLLGALEVDAEGNLANWYIPGKKMVGMGGAMDLCVGSKNVIVAMEHTNKGQIKIRKKCMLPYTAVGKVSMIVTEMGVINVTSNGLELVEYNPYYTLEEIQQATEAELMISESLVAWGEDVLGEEC